MDDSTAGPDNGLVRTQEQRDEQTLVITSMVIGPAMIWSVPLLFVATLLLAAVPLGPLPTYALVFATYVVVVVARLLTRGRR